MSNTPDSAVQSCTDKPTDIQIQVFESFEIPAPVMREWSSLADSTAVEIFHTPTWLKIWCHFYLRSRPLRILFFWHRERLVAVVPLLLDSFAVLGRRFLIAKPLGLENTVDYYAPTIVPEYALGVWSRLLDLVFVRWKCGILSLHRRRIGDTDDPLMTAAEMHRSIVQSAATETAEVYTEFRFPDGYSAYFESLSSDVRREARRRTRALQKAYPFEVHLEDRQESTGQAFDQFAELHKNQWTARGVGGHFADWPNALAYNRSLVQEFSKSRQVAFITIRSGETVLASKYTFTYNGTSYWRLPARQVGHDWDRFGLGRIVHLAAAEHICSHGCRRVEAGMGKYEYKLSFDGIEIALRSDILVSTRFSDLLRANLLCFTGKVLDRVYYRGWYNRISPRLRLRRGPLWEIWRRTRI